MDEFHRDNETSLQNNPLDELGLAELHLPADVKKGLEASIKWMGEYVSSGMEFGIELLLEPIKDALSMAANASNVKLEMTEESQKRFESIIFKLISDRLNEGVHAILENIANSTGRGDSWFQQHYRETLVNLFQLADRNQIALNIIPLAEDLPDGDQPVPTMSTLEETNHYVERVIDNHTMEGIAYKINSFREFVGSGSNFSDYMGTIRFDHNFKEIHVLAEKALKLGFTETSEMVLTGVLPDDTESLFGVKKINMEELDALLMNTLAENLPLGLEKTMENFGLDVARRPSTHLMFRVRDEIKEMYKYYGKEFGLLDDTLQVLVGNGYYNLEHWDDSIKEQVTKNIAIGVEAIVQDYLTRIREGQLSTSKGDAELDGYVEIGKKFGIATDVIEIKKRIAKFITPENVQAGTDFLLNKIRVAVVGGFSGEAVMHAQLGVPEVLSFIRDNGLDGKVDTKQLIDYLKQNGVEIGHSKNQLSDGDGF